MNSILAEHCLSTGHSLQIVQGDITLEEVDAIVNAANEQLQHRGVAWAKMNDRQQINCCLSFIF